jgi:hypothetical protein
MENPNKKRNEPIPGNDSYDRQGHFSYNPQHQQVPVGVPTQPEIPDPGNRK